MRLFRTILFAPGNRERMLAKVGKAGADAVVLDLEDAVPAPEKDVTRRRVGEAVGQIAQEDGAAIFVRVNPLADVTGFSVACGLEDIEAVVPQALRREFAALVEFVVEIGIVDMYGASSERPRQMLERSIGMLDHRGVAVPHVVGLPTVDRPDISDDDRWCDPVSREASALIRNRCLDLLGA